MEAAGSRQSRAASRYGASPSPPLFTGPVRKWKKQWATCSSNTNTNTNSNSNNNGAKRNEAPPLLLCRWTPLSAAAAAAEPPKRRFRYTPIVPIVKKGKMKSVVDGGEGGASLRNLSSNDLESMVEKPTTRDEPQEDDEDQADSSKSEGRA